MPQSLPRFRDGFDRHLQGYLQKKIKNYAQMAEDPFLGKIVAYSEDLTLHGGKRIRPYLANLGYHFLQAQTPTPVLRSFVALELFHIFALIHDDIIDEGTVRHGIPAMHVKVEQLLQRAHRQGDAAHIGVSQALLLGDLLLAWATEIMTTLPSSVDAAWGERARSLYFSMIDDVVLGQMIDVDLTTKKCATMAEIERKMMLKTASYTFVRPLQIGAALAGAQKKQLEQLRKIGEPLGLAFQIQDDLLDLTGTTKDIKKTVYCDLRDRQHTVFTQYIVEHGTPAQKRELQSLFGAALGEADRSRVLELFTASGSFAYGKALSESYFSQAERLGKNIVAPLAFKQELQELITYIQQRSL